MPGAPINQVALGVGVAFVCASTAGVPTFRRRPPVHSVLLGRCRLDVDGQEHATSAIAVPANTAHHVLEFFEPYAAVAYLDPRRFRFEDAQGLVGAWSGFVCGRSDPQEAVTVALSCPERIVDPRVLEGLGVMEQEDLGVVEAAQRLGLSPSRFTHLVTESLGAPPREWKAWFKLVRAIRLAIGGANMTEAAHLAGFADSAHLSRTCKRMTGLRPAKMIPVEA